MENAPQEKAPFLLEIGTEELPPGDVVDAVDQLEALVPDFLDEKRLEHGEIKVMATPRRLIVSVADFAPRQRDLEQLVKGPPADRAYDEDGHPTQAAEGFARSKGVTVNDLEVREMDGGEYVVAVERQQGRPAVKVLAEALPDLIAEIGFEQTMRWNESQVAFSRPIRWLLAYHDHILLPFSHAGIHSQPYTWGLRFLDPKRILVQSPAEYFQVLKDQGIILDQVKRKEEILKQTQALAADVGGEIPADPGLLTEVTHLVEAPLALRGEYDPQYLSLPREVLISVMKKHQRYFPVEKEGELIPYFITVANKPHHEGAEGTYQLVTQGNEDVILARFSDAEYFVQADMERDLEAYVPDLDLLTFQEDLGSMREKVDRIRTLIDDLAESLQLTEKEREITRRAAELCKADLVTQMVVEMTSLQGVMGYYYALHSGETEGVAIAIREHYLPRSAGDPAPSTKPGLALSIADRLDTLVGLFAAGVTPTGSKDPFGQRRAALGLVGNLIAWDVNFDLKEAIEAAAKELPLPISEEAKAGCLAFIRDRLQNALREEGYAFDVVDAVVAAQGENPAGASRAVKALSDWVEREDWDHILDSYARCVRITRDLEERFRVDPEVFVEEEERGLYRALRKAEDVERAPGDVDAFLQAFVPLIPEITRFFDEVLVMAEEDELRRNRLALLQRIAALADGVVDMSRLEGF
ncbi:MAG: glycine--tRNA ligase subunit beta [Anaerolineales bacterium]